MKRLLVVDDFEDFHEIIQLILEDEEVEIKCLLDTREFDSVMKVFKPNLVILDVNIGEVDGREVCNAIKSNPETFEVKVLLTSATTTDFMDYNCQPDGYFLKPFSITELKELVCAHLAI